MPEVVGSCKCPVCGVPDAEVKRGDKGRLYVNCDGCVTLIRSSSRAGQDRIRGMMNIPAAGATGGAASDKSQVQALATPEKKPDAVAAVAVRRKSSLADGLAFLGGRK